MSVREVNLHNNHSLESNRAAAVVSSICERVKADNPLCAPFFGNFWPPLGHFLGRFWGAVWVTLGSAGLSGKEFFCAVLSGKLGRRAIIAACLAGET